MSTNVDDTPNDHGALPSATTADPHVHAVPDPEPSSEPAIPPLRPIDPDWHLKGVPDTEFNRKYPPDPWGEEASHNARVWKLYRDERSSSDKTMLESWNKTLDVLLIFAGLFSAVSTAFLIESYKNLQPDYTQYVANVLYGAMILQNRSSDAISPLRTVGPPDTFIHTTSTQRWTNGLWFASLVVSLSVALLSILIKQWLDEYQLRTSRSVSSLRDRARRHCFYSDGLQTWGVPALISFLPVLLHVSLFLFFTGLVLFLVPLDKAIACSLLAIIAALALFYQCSIFLPLVYMECPSSTPLLAQTLRVWHIFLAMAGLARWGSKVQLSASREGEVLDSQKHHLDGSALAALLQSTADNDIIAVGVEAVGAVTSPAALNALVARCAVPDAAFDYLELQLAAYETISFVGRSYPRPNATYARALRASMTVAPYADYWHLSRYLPCIPDLTKLLGFDGLLLSLLDRNYTSGSFDMRRALAALRTSMSLVAAVGTRARQPVHRNVCLLFLSRLSLRRLPERDGGELLSLVGLVFCAGDFTRADAHELDSACSSLVQIVATAHPNFGGEGNASLVVRAFDCLCFMLARREVYAFDPPSSETIVREAVRFVDHMMTATSPGYLGWDSLQGMILFVHSGQFPLLVCTSPCSGEFLLLASFACYNPDFHEVTLERAWSCIAMLLKMSMSKRQENAQSFLAGNFLYPGTHFAHGTAALAALLDGDTAIGTWEELVYSSDRMMVLHSYTELADYLACLVCRHPVLRLADREPISLAERFFAGTFVASQFRIWMCHLYATVHCHSATARIRNNTWLSLARHCVQISPQGWLRVCERLETVGEDDTDLRAFCVDHVRKLRGMFTRNGEPYAECAPNCLCKPAADQPARVVRWRGVLSWTRFGREEV